MPEPYIVIRDIPLTSVQLLSANKNPTLKIHLDCGVDIMKFKSSQEEYEKFIEPNKYLTEVLDCGVDIMKPKSNQEKYEKFIKPNKYLTAVCRCSRNEWNGRVTAQLIIEDFYISEK